MFYHLKLLESFTSTMTSLEWCKISSSHSSFFNFSDMCLGTCPTRSSSRWSASPSQLRALPICHQQSGICRPSTFRSLNFAHKWPVAMDETDEFALRVLQHTAPPCRNSREIRKFLTPLLFQDFWSFLSEKNAVQGDVLLQVISMEMCRGF